MILARHLLQPPPKALVLLLLLTAPLISALVTYTFVSLPDASISLDTRGTLILMVVMLEFFFIGALGVFPIDINKLLKMRGRRDGFWNNGKHTFTTDFPCSIRILCELETAANTFDAVSSSDYDDAQGLNSSLPMDEDYLTESDLLEKDLLEEFQREAVRALSLNEKDSNEAMYRLGSLTGEGICEEAYQGCGRSLTPKKALKIVFDELGVYVKP